MAKGKANAVSKHYKFRNMSAFDKAFTIVGNVLLALFVRGFYETEG